jgi:hypothetical protein
MLRRLIRRVRDSRATVALAPPLAAAALRALRRSLRVRHHGRAHPESSWVRGEGIIVAFWHGQLLMMPFVYPGRRTAILVSQHRDGEYIARVAVRLGFRVVRGSATRGGPRAFRELMATLRDGWNVAITPDGPRGPRRQVKAGVLELARRTGMPILPVAFAAARARVLRRSWDGFFGPLPGSLAAYVWGEPVRVPPAVNRPGLAAYQRLLAERLDAVSAEAEALAAGATRRPSDVRTFARSGVRE